jgi:uncharacterized protein (DUF1778 family)
MSQAAKKSVRQPPAVVFAEERRLPLGAAARDAFLNALNSPAKPNAAAKAAAKRYKRSRGAKKA